MKTVARWLLVPALVVGVGYLLRAQETGEPRKTGKILILKSGHVMEGDIEQCGKQMCVRRGASEVWIPADKTIRLCPDWLDAYAFMQSLIKGDSANERVKLARWCHQNHLATEALAQARIALDLQPEHADAKQMVTLLERALMQPVAKTVVKTPTPTSTPTSAPAPKSEPLPIVDVTSETRIAFSMKVQPILMNVCASCHAGSVETKFRLERVADGGQKAATQRNLAAVIEQINLDRPTISPLLAKAVTPHGREPTAPIRDRSARPFQSLQQWIVETVARNPQLKDYRDAKSPGRTRSDPKTPVFSSERSEAPLEKNVAPMQIVERDWCDAAWFNDWAHPRGTSSPVVSTAQR